MSDRECGTCYHWEYAFTDDEGVAGYCPWTDEIVHEGTMACDRYMRGEQAGFVMQEADQCQSS